MTNTANATDTRTVVLKAPSGTEIIQINSSQNRYGEQMIAITLKRPTRN